MLGSAEAAQGSSTNSRNAARPIRSGVFLQEPWAWTEDYLYDPAYPLQQLQH